MLALSNEVLWEADQLYPAIGQDAWLLTQKQASMFLDAVVRINRPIRDPKVRSEYDSLVKMLRKATEGTPYRILIRAQ